MAKQAKCGHCKTVYRWGFSGRQIALKETACPKCGRELSATSHLSRLPILVVMAEANERTEATK